MNTIRVRFSTFTGVQLRPAEIVGQYRGIDLIRVRLLDTGACVHVHPNSIVRSA